MSSNSGYRRSINPEVLVVGIDVAKRQHVAAIRLSEGLFLRPFSFSNDRRGFEMLLTRVRAAGMRHGKSGELFALESTGHYGHALQHYLLNCGCSAVGINPFHTKRAKELEDNSPEKSDRKDARIIAELAAQGRGRRLNVPRGAFAELRRLGKLREDLVGERVRLMNRYKGLVDLVFPELTGLVGDVGFHSIRRLLAELPTAVDIGSKQYRVLRQRLWRYSIGHISEQRCRRIYEAAKESVGVREGLDAIRLEMQQELAAIDTVTARIKDVEGVQGRVLERVPYAGRLLTIPEMAPTTVATILGETGDLREYRNGDAVIKMAGLNLYTISSGTFRGRSRITKRGRPLLRHILYMAALRLSKRGSVVSEFHDRLASTKPGNQVATAIARKLLRLLIALVREDAVYEPGRWAVIPRIKATA
jgi:transposase